MFRKKTTVTRPDRDRLIKLTRTKANKLRWAMLIDELRRELDTARIVEPNRVSLQALPQSLYEQHLAPRVPAIEELFAPTNLDPGGASLL